MSLDASLLSTMSPEEREAIEGADETEIESLKNVSGAEKDDISAGAAPKDDDEDDDDADDGAAPVEGQAAAAAAEATPTPAATAPAPTEVPAEPAAAAPAVVEAAAPATVAERAPPVAFSYQLPDNYDERVANARTESEALVDRFEAGDMTKEEFKAAQTRLSDEQRQLDGMRIQADIAAQMQQQAADQRRADAVNRLFDEASTVVDYRKDQGKFRDLDTFVKALAADDANADKPLDWFLREGHKRVLLLHDLKGAAPAAPATPAAAAAKPATDAAKKAAAEARKPPVDAAPPTLADIPGGTGPGDVGGEFADILALDGQDFEDAIARMAKTDPSRWSRFQAGGQ